ncbi:MAG: MbnP family copper-binding protein, partial [Trueperaceae bacterium]
MKKYFLFLVITLLTFSFAQQDVTLNFALKAGSTDVTCGQQIALGTAQGMTELTDARLFLSNVRAITEGGEEVPLTLTPDNAWQSDSVTLLDFEDASGACQGTAETNTKIVGTLEDAATITGIAFTVGVPEELNHLDAATAVAPLNVTDMWWAWLFGYKFVKIDLTSGGMMTMPASTEPAGTEPAGTEPASTEESTESSEAETTEGSGESASTESSSTDTTAQTTEATS